MAGRVVAARISFGRARCSLAPMSTLQKRLAVVGTALAVIVLDQVSKAWALRELSDRTIPLFHTVEFDLSFNTGISFGAGASFGQAFGFLISGIVIVLLWVALRETRTSRALILGAVLGGAIGNLIDRVTRAREGVLSGDVVDFIDVSWFAVFNVADIFVVCGLGVLLVLESRHAREESRRESRADDPV